MSTTTLDDTLKITRRFKAPRERVFAAFTGAEAMKLWFGPPDAEILACTVDFRVGGHYRVSMRTPRMGVVGVGGSYSEIVPPEKIVMTWKWEDDEDWANLESLISFAFVSVGGETELRMTQTGFPVPESRDNHGHGWGFCFDKMDIYLANQQA